MDALAAVPAPRNEPVLDYAPDSPERGALVAEYARQAELEVELTCTIGGRQRLGGGSIRAVVSPHQHSRVLGRYREATAADAHDAVAAAKAAAPAWAALSYEQRAAVFLKAAELLSGPWRCRLNAATMLGQSKTVYQAEIDAACELIDFWRFNVTFGQQVLAEQPQSAPGVWNQLDHRPLEGFVYAISPFNFTAIAGNLPTAPALMGNVVIWKPSETQTLAAYYTMRLLEEAGLPPGVINLLTGDGRAVSEVLLAEPDLAGIHFTGSTATFQHLWREVAAHLTIYRTYPRLVGETGGKDFILAHSSADVDLLRTAMIRGAFEYGGQKCSAASRAYIPATLWQQLRPRLIAETEALAVGDVADLGNFMGAVIDRRAFDRLTHVLVEAAEDPSLQILAGGTTDDSVGFFVRPTLLQSEDPAHKVMTTEFFGPILSIYVYDDSEPDSFAKVLNLVDSSAAYGLTGAVIGRDRAALSEASSRLRFAAGNFYLNDKPTGAVVGQQPFGGGRASGTNDKAGSKLNLQRWVSPRTIKETFVAPVTVNYPHQDRE